MHDSWTGQNHQMKRTLALAVLIAALALLTKLSFKQASPDKGAMSGSTQQALGSGVSLGSAQPYGPPNRAYGEIRNRTHTSW